MRHHPLLRRKEQLSRGKNRRQGRHLKKYQKNINGADDEDDDDEDDDDEDDEDDDDDDDDDWAQRCRKNFTFL